MSGIEKSENKQEICYRDLNRGSTSYEEMTDDELDRQYEELKCQREERRKCRKEKDFEM